MRYCDSIFGSILKPISRRWFESVVARHDADAYVKDFYSWDHLQVLVFAQLRGIDSLRKLETEWNANSHHHYHLGSGEIARSTMSDANARRPAAVFRETFSMLSSMVERASRQEGTEMLRLIDSSPIPLGKVVNWAQYNGRIRGLKLHVAYEPDAENPTDIEITDANINDIEVVERFPVKPGFTYVFDKAYCKYPWWTRLHLAGCHFVTRQKKSTRLRAVGCRPVKKGKGDGFAVIDDAIVKFVSKGDSKLDIPLRRIRIKRDEGGKLTLITNDLTRPAVEIGRLYKQRWQIELLFRWIKQHLRIRRFLGVNRNAIELQIIAAMIAFILLRLAARENCLDLPIYMFAALLAGRLFFRLPLARIDKPPEIHPSRPQRKSPAGQLELCYA